MLTDALLLDDTLAAQTQQTWTNGLQRRERGQVSTLARDMATEVGETGGSGVVVVLLLLLNT